MNYTILYWQNMWVSMLFCFLTMVTLYSTHDVIYAIIPLVIAGVFVIRGGYILLKYLP